MLLKYIIGNGSSSDGLIFCTWSPDQDPITRAKCSFTESFLQVKFSANHKNNIIINDGQIPLNRILWQISTMPGAFKLVWVKPGSLLFFNHVQTISKLMEEYIDNDFVTEDSWGMITSSQKDFAILNPVHNDCFQGVNIDEWADKCKANNLEVRIVEQEIQQAGDNKQYNKFRTAFIDWVDPNAENDPLFANEEEYQEQIKNITASEREEILSFGTKTLVYYNKMTLPTEFKSHYENVIEFSSIEELEKIIDQQQENVSWLFGLKLTLPASWWKYGHHRLERVVKGMLAKPNSILYGYTFENNNILTSTFGDNNVHV